MYMGNQSLETEFKHKTGTLQGTHISSIELLIFLKFKACSYVYEYIQINGMIKSSKEKLRILFCGDPLP